MKFVDDADAWNAYEDAVVPLVGDFVTIMESAWVDYAGKFVDATTTQMIANANGYAAAVGRWAAAEGSANAGYTADVELAKAVRSGTIALASAAFYKAMHAADAVWVTTVLPAWETYADETSDHAADRVATTAPQWETAQNDIADAALAFNTAAVPVGTQLTMSLNENFSDWVSDVATADETYGNELAEHGVTWTGSVTAAEEGLGNDTIVNATTYVHLATGLDVLLTGAIGEAVINWTGTVAGQLTGMPYTPPATQYAQFVQVGETSGGGVTADQQPQPQQQPALTPPSIDWSSATLIGPDKLFGGFVYKVKTSTGKELRCWKPGADSKMRYFCHGYSFGGASNELSPYGNSVSIIVSECYVEVTAAQAAAGDVIVFYDEKGIARHSGVLDKVVGNADGSLNISQCTLISKAGSLPEKSWTLGEELKTYRSANTTLIFHQRTAP